MLGHPDHAQTNARLSRKVAARAPLIVSHGGVAVGSVAPNTTLAVRAALWSGADAVKIDVSGSTDNIFFAFHDGSEEELLGVHRNIQTLSAAEIGDLTYRWHDRPGRRARVERLVNLLGAFRGEDLLFALDRSWWRWPTLLKILDNLQMPDQLILKVPAWETDAIERLRLHKVKYPVLAICSDPEECAFIPRDASVNVIGVEALANTDDSPWFERAMIDALHDEGRLVWVNSETLTTGIPLFGGHDDERAVLQSPEDSWRRVLELGVDAVQTTLPWLLREVRASVVA